MKIARVTTYRSIANFAKQVYREWRLDRTVRLGASIAYYLLIALVPLLTLAIGIAGIFFSGQEVSSYIIELFAKTYGGSAESIESALNSLYTSSELSSALRNIGLVGIAGIVVTISFLVVALQDAMNVIWARPVVTGFKKTAMRYLAAYGVVFIIGSIILLSLLVQSLESFAVAIIPGDFNVVLFAARLMGSFVSLLVMVVFLALLTKIMLRARVGWRELLLGALFTALMLEAGTALLGYYFSSVGKSSAAGVFGGVLLVLGWMYYLAQILLLGLQFTKVLSYRLGNPELKEQLRRSDPLLENK